MNTHKQYYKLCTEINYINNLFKSYNWNETQKEAKNYNNKNYNKYKLINLKEIITEWQMSLLNTNIIDNINLYYNFTDILPKTDKEIYVFRSITNSSTIKAKDYMMVNPPPIKQLIPFSTSFSYEKVLDWGNSQSLVDNNNFFIMCIKVPINTNLIILDIIFKSEQEITLPAGDLVIKDFEYTDLGIPIFNCDFVAYNKLLAIEQIKTYNITKP